MTELLFLTCHNKSKLIITNDLASQIIDKSAISKRITHCVDPQLKSAYLMISGFEFEWKTKIIWSINPTISWLKWKMSNKKAEIVWFIQKICFFWVGNASMKNVNKLNLCQCKRFGLIFHFKSYRFRLIFIFFRLFLLSTLHLHALSFCFDFIRFICFQFNPLSKN